MTDLYQVTSKNWGSTKTNQLLLDAVYDIFSAKKKNPLFMQTESMKSDIITSGVAGEVIFANFAPMNRDVWGELVSLIFHFSIRSGLDLTSDSNFKIWINENGKRLNQMVNEGAYNSYWQRPPTEFLGLIEAGFITGNSDPEAIFKARYHRNKTSYKNLFDVELLKAIARRSTSGMIQSVEDTEFASRISHSLRGEIFASLASVGSLTKKAARKIRSDSSEEASDMGVKAIADNITKFKNAAEVLSQVMDTKHTNSAMYLARTIPKEYLPFMAVCQNQQVREIVVNRMQEASNV
jgi:hypothetical protein